MPFEDHEIEKFSLRTGDLLICEGGEPGRAAVWPGGRKEVKFQKAILRARMRGEVDPKWVMYSLQRSAATGDLENYLTGSGIRHFPLVAARSYELAIPPVPEQRRIVKRIETLFTELESVRKRLGAASTTLKRLRQAILAAACSGRLTQDWRGRPRLRNGDPVPPGWTQKVLRDVGDWFTGRTPTRRRADYFGGAIPWVKSGDLRDGPVTKTEESISQLGLEASAAKILPAGSVCVALYGATIGRVGLLEIDAATNQACASCVPRPRVADRRYLFYFLLSQRTALAEAGQGGAQPNLTNKIVRDWPIAIPPLEEQQEIARRLEAHFRQADAIEKCLAAANISTEKLTQSILAKASRGELVPTEAELARREGRDYEPAAHLLQRLNLAKTEAGRKPQVKRRLAS